MKIAMKSRKVSATKMGCFFFACLLLLCAGAAGWAQTGRGSVSGLITDPTGAILPDASITLLNHTIGIAQHTVTSTGGLYDFVSLKPETAYQRRIALFSTGTH